MGAQMKCLTMDWMTMYARDRDDATGDAEVLDAFSTYHICPHGDVCDGRWGWHGAPPLLIGHLVGVKAKFWILRLLGWAAHGELTMES